MIDLDSVRRNFLWLFFKDTKSYQDDQVIHLRGDYGGDAQGWEPRVPGAI